MRPNYKPEDVMAAMHAIWKGMSRRQAAKEFNIPRSTLLDKLDGKRPVETSPGPNPFLTKAEEQTLESWAIDLYQRGFPLKTEDLKDMAQAVIQNNQRQTSFKNSRPGRSWMRNFLLRHPKVYEISTDMAAGPRRTRTVTTREEVRQWCLHVRQFLTSLGHENVLDSPHRIFNVDHAEFLFDSSTGLLTDQERNERIDEKPRDSSDQSDSLAVGMDYISIVATFTAAGGMAPLMFVYPSQGMPQEDLDLLPPKCIQTYTESGLLTGKSFLDYIILFRKWLEQENTTLPVLLLVDGRRSRLNIDVTRYCEEQGIILYCLFPTPKAAISEILSPIIHDSSSSLNKLNFASRVHETIKTLEGFENSGDLPSITNVLPHLQSMLQTLGEVRAEPVGSLPPPAYSLLTNNCNFIGQGRSEENCDSDCEFDVELTPVEGEIEIEFPDVDNVDPYAMALHPALLADSDVPKYLIFHVPPTSPKKTEPTPTLACTSEDVCIEDRVDQPDVKAHLIVKPLSSPLPETENGIAKVESEINDVLDTMLSFGTSHQVECEQLSPLQNSSEEPFLGFSSDNGTIKQSMLDAHSCLRFIECIIAEKNLLQDFKLASTERQWNGAPEAKYLFEVWLAANDGNCR